MHSPLIVKAYAKINLFLNILAPREDGFHDLRSVMQTVDLADLLELVILGRVDSWVHEDADSRKEQPGVYTEINDAAEQRTTSKMLRHFGASKNLSEAPHDTSPKDFGDVSCGDREDAPQGPKCQHALGNALNIELNCNIPGLSGDDNLVTKAYYLFYSLSGLDPIALKVNLTKNIPVEAGLGGGSSDAAAMLMALNKIHNWTVPKQELFGIAAQLGSDVPFFLEGGTCLVSGKGESVEPMPDLSPRDVVILKPRNLSVSTAMAYSLIRKASAYTVQDFSGWNKLFKTPIPLTPALSPNGGEGANAPLTQPSPPWDLSEFFKAPFSGERLLFNDFEQVLFPLYPQLSQAKSKLLQLVGLPGALLSGSGPSMFGILNDPETQYSKIQEIFSRDEWFIHRCKTLSFTSPCKDKAEVRGG